MTNYIYAIIGDDEIVENIIAADDSNFIDVLRLMIPEAKDIILVTEETFPAYIGGDVVDGKFRMPKPFPSWTWSSELWKWVAPVPYPEGDSGFTWDEDTLSWTVIPPISVDNDSEQENNQSVIN